MSLRNVDPNDGCYYYDLPIVFFFKENSGRGLHPFPLNLSTYLMRLKSSLHSTGYLIEDGSGKIAE